jgi:hypothetical protein
MLSPKDRFQQNRDQEIAAQVFEDEAVIMRLTDGAYFSMNRVGGLIWEAVESGGTLAEAVSAVTRRFEVTPEEAGADIGRLLETMVQERLLTRSPGTDPPPPRVPGFPESAVPAESVAPPYSGAPRESRERLSYEPPFLSRHDDVADLLALDPPFGEDCLCGRDREKS